MMSGVIADANYHKKTVLDTFDILNYYYYIGQYHIFGLLYYLKSMSIEFLVW